MDEKHNKLNEKSCLENDGFKLKIVDMGGLPMLSTARSLHQISNIRSIVWYSAEDGESSRIIIHFLNIEESDTIICSWKDWCMFRICYTSALQR